MATLTRRRLRFVWRYVRGNTPWDSGIVPPEIVAWVEAAESTGMAPGRALDLGCGTGTTSIYLAAHEWDVLGVDFAPNAIWRARRKARRHRVRGAVAFLSADVSRPDFLAAAVPFDLVVDVGCLHSLLPEQRAAYAAHLARLTRPGATYLLYAFMPRLSRDGKRHMGIDRAGLQALFGPAFELVDYTLGEEATAPVPSGWYTFRRTGDRS
jgi:cyclopropane fatty-acyl-phospholipid synthase-like methyltransferase